MDCRTGSNAPRWKTSAHNAIGDGKGGKVTRWERLEGGDGSRGDVPISKGKGDTGLVRIALRQRWHRQ